MTFAAITPSCHGATRCFVRLYIPSGGEFRLAARSHTENLTDGTMKILQRSERMSLSNY
jgi:hypothetical protein